MDAANERTPDNGSAKYSLPTQRERMELVRVYQREAMARLDPLAANLGVIEGDLMSFAHTLGTWVQTQLTQGAISEETHKKLVANMELYLKVVRQSDRLAQIERQLDAASSGSSPAPESR